ncbi:MAG TPA: hypothetical protein VLK27_03060 [Chthoniobacterales bacterium]|nr:hypothetical protein [Chthoniobacterales bacterium]
MRALLGHISVVITVALFSVISDAAPDSVAARPDGVPRSGKMSPEKLVAQGEVLDKKLEASEALSFYLAAEKLEPKNAHLMVCIARQYRHLMQDASPTQEKLRLGHLALDYSARAAAAGPNDAEAQLDTAISLGKMSPIMSIKEQVKAAPRIKESADKAIALDPKNDTAWYVLGKWNRVLADVNTAKRAVAGMFFGRLPKGSNEEAERDMRKALELNPDRLMHYIELGRVYAQMGRKEDARFYINKGLAMPDAEKDDPEAKQHGRETLAKL